METLIRHIIYWETGVSAPTLTVDRVFGKALSRGISCDPADSGGPTLVGITHTTYAEYCRKKGIASNQLSRLDFRQWMDIFTVMFWNRWNADLIVCRKTARMLVDWLWTSGSMAIRLSQSELGVKTDGIAGPKTISAINSLPSEESFMRIRKARIAHIESICRSRPVNLRFRTGWLRRIDAL